MFGGPREAQLPGLSGPHTSQYFSEEQESACLPSILVAALAKGHSPKPPGASVHYAGAAGGGVRAEGGMSPLRILS